MLRHENILRVVKFSVRRIYDTLNDTRLQIEQDRSRYVMIVIGLIEKHVLTIVALGGEFF